MREFGKRMPALYSCVVVRFQAVGSVLVQALHPLLVEFQGPLKIGS
jgi:hypothetical protein